MMRYLSALAVLAVVAGCVEPTAAPAPQTFHLSATLSGANGCTVNAPDNVYYSTGLFFGDQPKKFVSTFDKNYHGFGCWVAVDGHSEAQGAANLYVVFSGNTFGKPLAVGTYGVRFEVLDDTPAQMATIRFQSLNLGNDELRPLDNAAGSIVVDSASDGTRSVHIDLQVIRYTYAL